MECVAVVDALTEEIFNMTPTNPGIGYARLWAADEHATDWEHRLEYKRGDYDSHPDVKKHLPIANDLMERRGRRAHGSQDLTLLLAAGAAR